ncbi:uncharacterized protein LOC130541769 isoform X2 [Pan paniscus]|uniref:uncharacterized protein LOC130541769 isoform X2 n=1 Tax=Pan paniscus TaxID=9597 RepID=UPI0025465084|nr:uncharacterized protein LOC130541769 isoform X4 [Pan paniscus]
MLCFRYKEEASQSWWKARRSKSHLMWMAAGKESLCRHKMNKMSVTTLRPLTPSLLCIKSHIWTLTEPSHVRCSILSFIYSRMSYSWYKVVFIHFHSFSGGSNKIWSPLPIALDPSHHPVQQ